MGKQYSTISNQIQLTEKDPDSIGQVQLLKVGNFLHPNAPGGKFSITPDTLRKMQANFNENVRRLDGGLLAVDYSHRAEEKAAGWIESVELREDDTELWIHVDWTKNAAEMIVEKEFRFISADLDFDYMDNESGVRFGPTLLGAGLVNRPHIKGMSIILEEKNNNNQKRSFTMDEKEMLKKIAELEAALASLKSQMDAMRGEKVELEGDKEKMGAELEEAKAELKEKTAELITLKEEKVTAEKEAKFSELINEGKITPAQKDDFMKMDLKLAESFFANAPVLNLNESGHGKTPKGETGNKSVDDQIEEKALVLMEENKTLKIGEAYSQVMKENPELAKQHDEQFKNVVES